VEENAQLIFETRFVSTNVPVDSRLEELIYWGKRFFDTGMVEEAGGNLSYRTEKGFVVSGTGVYLNVLSPETVSEVIDIKEENRRYLVYANGTAVPSRECLLHSYIYQQRREINAVFHTHDETVVAIYDKLGVPCTIGEQPRGSSELASEACRVLEAEAGAQFIILRNHGIISLGKTMQEAGQLAEEIHKAALRIIE